MSNKDAIVDTINSFGSIGIKKTELKKQYAIENFDILLDELNQEDKICISKKGNSIYCWSKEFFLDYLESSDPKFKYLYKDISIIQNKINDYSDSVFKYIENIDCKLVEIKNSFNGVENKIYDLNLTLQKNSNTLNTFSLDDFKDNFDRILGEKSSSIGWVELSSIKNEICHMYNISDNEFYDYVRTITELAPEKYELSSGGYEGVILRGIVHGFVRCI
jgi:hypothetical protein